MKELSRLPNLLTFYGDSFMTEKPCPKVDEVRYFKENLEYLKAQLAQFGHYTAGNPENEAEIKRTAAIDFALIYLMFEDAFYNGKFHFYDQYMVAKQLRTFRPDLSLTDDEITDSLRRCTDRKRLFAKEFMSDFHGLVMKFVYNVNYWQPPEKSPGSQNPPPYTPPSFGEPNPFSSDEFRKLQDEFDKL